TAVQDLTGVTITNHVVVKMTGVIGVVDAINGVTMCFPEPVKESRRYGTLDLPAGEHTLTGHEAISFLRARHGTGMGLEMGSDLTRIQRQQAFIDSAIRELLSQNIITNSPQLYGVIEAVLSSISADPTIADPTALAGLAFSLRNIKPSEVVFTQLPVVESPRDKNRVEWTSEADAIWQRLIDDAPAPGQEPADPRDDAAAPPAGSTDQGGGTDAGTTDPGAGTTDPGAGTTDPGTGTDAGTTAPGTPETPATEERLPGVCPCRGPGREECASGPTRGPEACEAAHRLVQHVLALDEREPHARGERALGRRPGGAERAHGHGDHARQRGQLAAQRGAVVEAERGAVGDDEVRALRHDDVEPGAHEPLAQQVAPRRERVGERARRLVVGQGVGDRGLERRARRVGEELLDRAHRGHERLGTVQPADLPPGERERLARRRD